MTAPPPIPPSGFPIRSISDGELRDKFNASGFVTRWKRGELYDVLVDPGDPESHIPHEPAGTLSQRVVLVSTRTHRAVAEFHWYLRPDFSIGGWVRSPAGLGDPDPKGLLDRQAWYRVGFIEREG